MKLKLNISKGDLQAVIEDVEATQTFTTRNALADAVANTDWAKNFLPKPVTAPTVINRIKEFGIVPKTPVGKRGRQPGSGPVPRGPKKNKVSAGFAKDLLASVPTMSEDGKYPTDRFTKIAQKVIAGSKQASIKMKCLECCGYYYTQEIKNCQCTSCPLWWCRPYK